jgi:hypothetical protein
MCGASPNRLSRILEASREHIGHHQRAPRRHKVGLIDDGCCRHSFDVPALLAQRQCQSGLNWWSNGSTGLRRIARSICGIAAVISPRKFRVWPETYLAIAELGLSVQARSICLRDHADHREGPVRHSRVQLDRPGRFAQPTPTDPIAL